MTEQNPGVVAHASDAPRSVFARLRSLAGRQARSLLLVPSLVAPRGRGRVLFLPSTGPRQSSLLRAYLIAAGLRTRGWSTLTVPPQLGLSQRNMLLRHYRPDLVFVQKSRHPLNDPAYLSGWRLVYDLDDADFIDPDVAARIAATCRAAQAIIAGSAHVADWCAQHGRNVHVVWTGTPVTPGARRPHAVRPALVAWAQLSPFGYPEEFTVVEALMLRLAARRPDLALRLYGRRPGEDDRLLGRLRAAGVAVEWLPALPYDRFLASLQDAAIGLSPICVQSPYSRGKSFGKVLGYLDARTPVVASDEAEHRRFFDAESGVISNDPDVWLSGAERLLADPAAREAMAARAFARFQRELSIDAAVDKVEAILKPLLAQGAQRTS